jgi:glycine betaine/choline ABC-type transport system substrate-binding protein
MKRSFIIISLLLLWVPGALACTNFPINVGVMDTPEGRVLAESLAILVNERSGVTVGTHYFKTDAEMEKAIADKRLEMIIENTSSALRKLNKVVGDDPEQNLETVKNLYKSKEMIWLKPFPFKMVDEKGMITIMAPVITRKSLAQFPALPRLISKFSKKVNDQAIKQLVKGVKGSKKPRNAAKDFLVDQNLI